MSDDLTTRLLAAIEATERNASAPRPGRLLGLDGKLAPEDVMAPLLRHCAAHRKIVDGYRDMQKAMDEAPVASRVFVKVALDVYEVVIEHLAAGYGLTTTGEVIV